MSEWKIFQMNECDWIVARSMDEAKTEFIDNYAGETMKDEHELTTEEMDSLKMRISDENEQPTGEKISFREYLNEMISEGLSKPTLFASTEW